MKSSSKLLRYVVGGLLIGGFWYLNRERPPWVEALRTIIVFAILMTVLKARFKRRLINVHLVPLITSKVVLVVIAAIVEQRLRPSTSNPSLIVAIGLAAAVTLLGTIGDSRYFTRAVPADRLPTP